MKGISLIVLILFGLCPLYSQGQNFKNEFGFRSDNDSYLGYGQDRYYTNGLFISYRHALKQENLNSKVANKIWEAEVGQYMYNAQTGQVRNILDVDRPFAAFLYTGLKLNWYLKSEKNIEASVNIGTIGPDAFGKETQETLHDIVGFYKINGWQYQINNELGVNASLKYSSLIARKQADNDFSLQSYLNLGNTFAGAGAGILFRAGRINKFFQSVSTNSRISNSVTDSIPKKEIFFFTRPMLNYIAYDATVEGGFFTNNKGPVTYNAKPFQYSQEFGINYAANRWTFNFSVLFKSRDTKVQLKPHQFGSAIIYYRFN
ncbi:MAG: lipid A deacylase LpxR family protein [Pyrinomonadaceae bacterium]|nr:lipid A deacylase LpxR family protein [Sphingobacteriaceae bacterium]